MDYDKFNKVPRIYDKVRTHTPEIQQQWLDLIAQNAPEGGIKDVIDLGSGTGRYSQLLAERFNASVVAVEPSDEMREQALAKSLSERIAFKKGSGENIPVPDASADMIFMSMVLHHLHDVAATARECYRVLRQNGVLCGRNTTSDAGLVHQKFFPAVS